MKNYRSFIALLIVICSLFGYKYNSLRLDNPESYVVTKWDVYGYYMYLPGIFIYNDLGKLAWHDSIQAKYSVMGDRYYQVSELENGNKVGKYLTGVALMQAPFFLVGHEIAKHSHYPADGFSPPYQYAVSIGLLVYILLAFVLLRWLLLQYFSDFSTALTLLLLFLATNLVQYLAIETVQSHAPIFFLYVLQLVFTHQWHRKPKLIWAALIGATIGLATISRPTELIMFLIPLLWGMQSKKDAHFKWQMVKNNPWHLVVLGSATFLAAFPQMLYWRHVTGSFLHENPSAWDFLTPHLQVLFGFEKGWFIYTPITLFFVVGMFKLKDFPFKKSVLWFGLLNIYIIISWRDWHYGASYSTRALVQSYPVMALALAAFIEHIKNKKWRFAFYAFAIYAVFINLFQVYQYNNWILHYDWNTYSYYKRIYLKTDIDPLDVSYLDTKDRLRRKHRLQTDTLPEVHNFAFSDSENIVADLCIAKDIQYIEVEMKAYFEQGYFNSRICVEQGEKLVRFRSNHPQSSAGKSNPYHFIFEIEEDQKQNPIKIYIENEKEAKGIVHSMKIISYALLQE